MSGWFLRKLLRFSHTLPHPLCQQQLARERSPPAGPRAASMTKVDGTVLWPAPVTSCNSSPRTISGSYWVENDRNIYTWDSWKSLRAGGFVSRVLAGYVQVCKQCNHYVINIFTVGLSIYLPHLSIPYQAVCQACYCLVSPSFWGLHGQPSLFK